MSSIPSSLAISTSSCWPRPSVSFSTICTMRASAPWYSRARSRCHQKEYVQQLASLGVFPSDKVRCISQLDPLHPSRLLPSSCQHFEVSVQILLAYVDTPQPASKP